MSKNPAHIKRVLDAGKGTRKSELTTTIGSNFDPDDVAETLREILSKAASTGGSAARPVEWIGAAATLAAGALAA